MAYKYKCFIPQNTAPKGAKSIGVYDGNGNKIHTIPLGRLTPTSKEKTYSFGLISDIHLWGVEPNWKANTKFDNALTYFESKSCVLCVVCGDLTQTGLYRRTDENDANTTYLDEAQLAKYKEICDKHTIPICELAGNHESYYSQPIINNIDKWETYTGKRDLSYTVMQGNDLFVFLGQPNANSVMSDKDFEWFKNLLASNRDKRCFVFVHSYIEEDSGDAVDYRENSIFDNIYWGKTNRNAFMDLLKRYPNTIFFHGHSHIKFECQELDNNATYTEKNGFKSVHVPSLGRPRNIDITAETTPYVDSEAQGYIVDVYDDCIVLNGMDFINNIPVPLGVYKIKTT